MEEFHWNSHFQHLLKMACEVKYELLYFACSVSFIGYVVFNKR